MSTPSRWGPPGYDDVASSPTVPLSPGSRPAAAPRPTAAYPTPYPPRRDAGDREAFEFTGVGYQPPVLDDYEEGYAEPRRSEYRGGRPRRRRRSADEGRPLFRAQGFSFVVLLLAVGVAALLGWLTYQALGAVDLVSADPLGGVMSLTSAFAVVGIGVLAVIGLSLIALLVAKPKILAGTAFVMSVLLPVVSIVIGFGFGLEVLRQNVSDDIQAAPAEAASRIIKELEGQGLPIGPLSDAVDWAKRQIPS